MFTKTNFVADNGLIAPSVDVYILQATAAVTGDAIRLDCIASFRIDGEQIETRGYHGAYDPDGVSIIAQAEALVQAQLG